MDAFVSGPIVIDHAFKDILVNHWQDKIDLIVADLGLAAGLLTVPNSSTGYALGRIYQSESSPSCCIYRDMSAPKTDDVRLQGAPIRCDSIVRVRIRQSPEQRQDAYRNMSIYAQAARETIMKYWRAYHSSGAIKAYILGVNDITDESASSIYDQRQIEGFTDLGAGYDANDEICECVFSVEHKIAHPVSYTP